MKIKIKDFKGIFTNLDENDSNLEAVRESINFAHKRGFLEFVPRHLETRVDLPETNGGGYFYNGQWELETGIYTTLTSDRLATNPADVPTSYNVLVLISKVEDAGTYHRLIHLHDGTNWWELSNYTSPMVNGYRVIDLININTAGYDQSLISTTIEGTPYFQVEDGRLKIYMPHMAFWVGRIERKIWITDHSHRWPVTDPGTGNVTYPYMNYETGYWYIDRLVDYWDYRGQLINYDGTNYGQPPASYNKSLLKCAIRDDTLDFPGRRLGLVYKLELDTNPTNTVGGIEITIGGLHDNKIRRDTYEGVPAWAVRHNIVAADTGVGVNCPWKPFPSYPNIWTFPIDTARTNSLGWDWDDPDDINTNSSQWPHVYLIFEEGVARNFHKYNDDAWTYADMPGAVWNPNGVIAELPGPASVQYGPCWSIRFSEFLAMTWEYRGDQQIQDVGYGTSDDKFSIVATMLLDDREEVPVIARNYTREPSAKYAIKISDITIPYDISKRVTRLRFYHRLKDGSDFEMVKEFDFLSEEGVLQDFSFVEDNKTGDTLAGNIGYLWNLWEQPQDLRIVTGFRSFITESGISIGLATYDAVSIFHSTFGGGQLMPDLIYDDNRIPVSGVAKLTAVGNADGRLMAFTDNTAYAIEAEEVSGVIGFRIEDTVELGVKNQQDIANIQGGVAVHTRHGIYITNGFETKSITEPIDDIIEQYYSTGRIYYNRYKHILYYKPTNAEDFYRYRFKDNVWERINKTTEESIVEEEEEAID